MTDLVSFGIIAVAVTLLGLFMIRRARAESRLSMEYGGATQEVNIAAKTAGRRSLILFKTSNVTEVPKRRSGEQTDSEAVVNMANRSIGSGFDSASHGIEYHFHSKLGMLTIASIPGLPSAVELGVAGKIRGTFISAEFAANAVAEGQTDHKELNALRASERPRKLSDWEKSSPHYFRT